VTINRGGSVILQFYGVIPGASVGEVFRGFFGEDFAMVVVLFWHYLLPSTLFLVCSCFSQLLRYSSFGDSSLEPDFIAVFPAGNASYPCWGCVLSLSSFERGLPDVSVYRRNRSESFDMTSAPVNIWIGCLKEWVTQDEVVASNIWDKESMKSFLTIIID